MSTKLFFNPSPAAQGQLLEALASGQFSVNQLAQTFNTTAEALSLFITTDSFATRFAAIGATNASLIRFSAGLNLHSAVRLLNTLALKLDEQLRTIPIDYTNPLSIEQFRRRAECARQVASALYRLSRFTHEPRPSRASNSDSNFDATSYQTRPLAPATHQPLPAPAAVALPPATPAQITTQPQTPEQMPEQAQSPAPTSIEARDSGTSERSDPGTSVPAPRDQQPTPTTNAAPAHEPAPSNTPPATPSATPLPHAANAFSLSPSAAPPFSESSPSASATSPILPSASAFPASPPAGPAKPKESPPPRQEIARAA